MPDFAARFSRGGETRLFCCCAEGEKKELGPGGFCRGGRGILPRAGASQSGPGERGKKECGAGGRRGAAASRRIGRRRGEGVEGRAAGGKLRRTSPGTGHGRFGAEVAGQVGGRESGGISAAQGVEVAEAGSRGGLHRGSVEALRAGSWRISAESEVAEKSREPEMFSRGGVADRRGAE